MEGMSIAIWDLVVLGIVLIAVIRGAMKGFVWQLATIAAIVLCFLFAQSLSVMIAPLIGLKEPLNRWVAMFFLYVVFSFLSFAIARSLRESIEEAKFTEYDKHMGAVLGLLKGVALALVLTFFSVTLSEQARTHVMTTHSGKFAAIMMDRLHPVLPEELHTLLEPYIHRLDHDGLDLHHNHDDEHEDDLGHHDSQPPATGEAGDEMRRLESLVAQLPGMHDPELRQLAIRALLETRPEHRQELIKLLATGVPGLTRIIATEWLDGKPDGADETEGIREQLLMEVSGFYFSSSGSQSAFREEVELDLSGLPLAVETAVLEDWHADLMGFDPDPDPTTDFSTALDRRILSQLRAARISIDSLGDTALRERLSDGAF